MQLILYRELSSNDIIEHAVQAYLQFRLGGILAERAHDCAQLASGDRTVAIAIEKGEGLFELCTKEKRKVAN